jgi:hypothetical protein
MGKGAGASKSTVKDAPLRRSTKQKAQPCSVPVSKRATQRLMKAFGMVGPIEPIGDHAMEAYLNSFHTPMTDNRIKAVRMLTSLDSESVLAASAQLAAEQEMVTDGEEMAA